MRLAILAALALLPLAACSKSNAPEPDAAPPTPTTVMLAGIDLSRPVRALGTEPFWSLDLANEAMVMTRPGQANIQAPASGPVVQGTTAVYSGTTNTGQTLVVTIIATECSDGMSDRTYPLTARIELGEQTLNGCANTTDALLAQSEA